MGYGRNPLRTGADGYSATWGYQSHEEFPFLHVGHRYYDPALGRFLQRDPIGIEGGLNVYAYVGNLPTIWIDPDGLHHTEGPVHCANGPCPPSGGGGKKGGMPGVMTCAVAVAVCDGPQPGPADVVAAGVIVVAGVIIVVDAVIDAVRKPYEKKKPGRKKQGREAKEKKRQDPDWEPRNPPREPPPHTPSKKD